MIRSVFDGYSANCGCSATCRSQSASRSAPSATVARGLELLAVGFDRHDRVRDEVREPRRILGFAALRPDHDVVVAIAREGHDGLSRLAALRPGRREDHHGAPFEVATRRAAVGADVGDQVLRPVGVVGHRRSSGWRRFGCVRNHPTARAPAMAAPGYVPVQPRGSARRVRAPGPLRGSTRPPR